MPSFRLRTGIPTLKFIIFPLKLPSALREKGQFERIIVTKDGKLEIAFVQPAAPLGDVFRAD